MEHTKQVVNASKEITIDDNDKSKASAALAKKLTLEEMIILIDMLDHNNESSRKFIFKALQEYNRSILGVKRKNEITNK